MKKIFKITDTNLINEMLDSVDYGVLSMSGEKPYAVPVNFVYLNNAIYFHGSLSGRKMSILKTNNSVVFSIVSDEKIIPSYFSSNDNLACPATAFFKSIIIEGNTEIINERKEKALVFNTIMKKFQPEGRYIPMESSEYDNVLEKVAVIKINIENLSAKFKFGQNLDQKRFDMIIENFTKRGQKTDISTAKLMKKFYSK